MIFNFILYYYLISAQFLIKTDRMQGWQENSYNHLFIFQFLKPTKTHSKSPPPKRPKLLFSSSEETFCSFLMRLYARYINSRIYNNNKTYFQLEVTFLFEKKQTSMEIILNILPYFQLYYKSLRIYQDFSRKTHSFANPDRMRPFGIQLKPKKNYIITYVCNSGIKQMYF